MYRATLTKSTTVDEFYDHIKKACLAGSFPSITGNNCKYRLDGQPESDKACVVGIFIPNKEYSISMDKYIPVQSIINSLDTPDWLLKEYENGKNLFMIMQGHHDDYAIACKTFNLKWDNRIFLLHVATTLATHAGLAGVDLGEIQSLFPNG